MSKILIFQAIEEKAEILGTRKLHKENPQRSEAVGEVRNIKGRIHLGGQKHFYMEPNAALVVPSGEKREIVVNCGTQSLDNVQGIRIKDS